MKLKFVQYVFVLGYTLGIAFFNFLFLDKFSYKIKKANILIRFTKFEKKLLFCLFLTSNL